MLFNSKLTLEQQRQDLQKLLQPISEESPSGANTRVTPEGREQVRGIESLFKDALTAERKLLEFQSFKDENRPPPDEPKWNGFIDLTVEYLEKTSKDLVLATLATEASIREMGVRGLLLGTELITGMIDKFWPTVYPLQDADATANRRFAALRQVYDWPDRVASRMEMIVKITAAGTTFAQCSDAIKLESAPANSREEHIRTGGKTVDTIKSEIRQREVFFKSLYQDLLDSKDALENLTEKIQEKCSPSDPTGSIFVPNFGRVTETLMRMISNATAVSWPGLLPDESASAKEDAPDAHNSAASTTAVPSANAMSGEMNREIAFTQLKQLADFFRRTEPHSPISYAIEQTVRWGKMSLPDLLTELITNADSRRNLFERTGLPASTDSGPS